MFFSDLSIYDFWDVLLDVKGLQTFRPSNQVCWNFRNITYFGKCSLYQGWMPLDNPVFDRQRQIVLISWWMSCSVNAPWRCCWRWAGSWRCARPSGAGWGSASGPEPSPQWPSCGSRCRTRGWEYPWSSLHKQSTARLKTEINKGKFPGI